MLYEKFFIRKTDSAVTHSCYAFVRYSAIWLSRDECFVFHSNQCIILYVHNSKSRSGHSSAISHHCSVITCIPIWRHEKDFSNHKNQHHFHVKWIANNITLQKIKAMQWPRRFSSTFSERAKQVAHDRIMTFKWREVDVRIRISITILLELNCFACSM